MLQVKASCCQIVPAQLLLRSPRGKVPSLPGLRKSGQQHRGGRPRVKAAAAAAVPAAAAAATNAVNGFGRLVIPMPEPVAPLMNSLSDILQYALVTGLLQLVLPLLLARMLDVKLARLEAAARDREADMEDESAEVAQMTAMNKTSVSDLETLKSEFTGGSDGDGVSPLINSLGIDMPSPITASTSPFSSSAFDSSPGTPSAAKQAVFEAATAAADRAQQAIAAAPAAVPSIASNSKGFRSTAGSLLSLMPLAAATPSRVGLYFGSVVYGLWQAATIVENCLLGAAVLYNWPVAPVKSLHALLDKVENVLWRGALVLVSVVGIWAFLAWRSMAMERLMLTMHDSPELGEIIMPLSSVLSYTLVAAATLSILQTAGIDMTPLLAFGGASSIIVGLATQQVLSNAVSGINIFLTRPFAIGEAVTVTNAGQTVTGNVASIRPLRTCVATDDGTIVSIPNKILADAVISNRSRVDAGAHGLNRALSQLQFRVRVAKDYAKLPALLSSLRSQLAQQPGVDVDKGVHVEVNRYQPDNVELLARCWLKAAPNSGPGANGGRGSGSHARGHVLTASAARRLQHQLLLTIAQWVQQNNGTLLTIA